MRSRRSLCEFSQLVHHALALCLAAFGFGPTACAQHTKAQPQHNPPAQATPGDSNTPPDKPSDKDEQDDRVYETILIGEESFKLEVAADNESRARGLMGRTSIPKYGGMLFVFDVPNQQFFWMKGCLIDIDVIFLDRNGRITAMHEMKKPRPRGLRESQAAYERRLPYYSSRRPAQFAIELKAGTLDRLKLRRYSIIKLDREKLLEHVTARKEKKTGDKKQQEEEPTTKPGVKDEQERPATTQPEEVNGE